MNLPNKLTLARILLVPVFMVFVSLTQYGTAGYQPGLYRAAGVVFALILTREFAVSGLRMVAAGAKDGKVIAANMWGKVKTVLQMLSIIFYYFAAALGGPTDPLAVGLIANALCWLVAAVTAISGIKYLVDNRHSWSGWS